LADINQLFVMIIIKYLSVWNNLYYANISVCDKSDWHI